MSQPATGPSRERGEGQKKEKRLRAQSTPSQPQHDVHASKRVRREKEEHNVVKPRREMDTMDHDKPRARAASDVALPACVRGRQEEYTHASPSPPLRRPRSASATMPGSLFSRSPTPDRLLPVDDRHVRFASNVISPVPRRRRHPAAQSAPRAIADEADGDVSQSQSDEEYDGSASDLLSPDCIEDPVYSCTPSPPHPLSSTAAGPSRPASATPFRPPAIQSVKDAIAKLDGDSPPRVTRPETPGLSAKDKGKAREAEPRMPWPSLNKGKGRELAKPRLDTASRLPSTVGSVEGARRVDAFLRSETAGTDEDSQPITEKEAAQKRIRELEEKVRSLENEVCVSNVSKRLLRFQHIFPVQLAGRPPPQRDPDAPPPPPPPPPPFPMSSTSRIPLSSSPRRLPSVSDVLTSVRAGLKVCCSQLHDLSQAQNIITHQQTSNAPETVKAMPKNRLPTVPTDKMEAFLSELKTVRLRKVGSGGDLGRDTRAASLSSWSSRDHSQSSSQGSSLVEDRSMVGYKRKRAESGNEAQNALCELLYFYPVFPCT